MEVLRETIARHTLFSPDAVSILVLMEVLRETDNDHTSIAEEMNRSFNPCSNGSTTRETTIHGPATPASTPVSILVLMEVLREMRPSTAVLR